MFVFFSFGLGGGFGGVLFVAFVWVEVLSWYYLV